MWHSYDNNDQLGDGSKIEDVIEDWDESSIEDMLVAYGMDQFGASWTRFHAASETQSCFRKQRAGTDDIGREGEIEAFGCS